MQGKDARRYTKPKRKCKVDTQSKKKMPRGCRKQEGTCTEGTQSKEKMQGGYMGQYLKLRPGAMQQLVHGAIGLLHQSWENLPHQRHHSSWRVLPV